VSVCCSVGVWFGLLGCLLVLSGCEEDAILEVAWSPDGRWLAYVRGESLYVAPVTPARALRARAVEEVVKEVPDPHLSWSSSSQEFLFTSTAKGGWDIWRARLGEAGRWKAERLTTHPAKDWGAVFAPDGRRFVFLSYRGGQCDLWLSRLAGGSAQPLTDDPAEEWALSFGVDRALLYYLRTAEGGVSQLRGVDLNSRAHGVVAEGLQEVSEAVASPGRQRVAIVAGGELSVYSLVPGAVRGFRRAVATRGWSRLGPGHDVAWSSAGDRLVFVDRAGQVRVVGFEGGRASWDRRFAGRLPRLGPEGRRLAWVVEPSPQPVSLPNLVPEVKPRGSGEPLSPELIFIGQLPVAQYQCVYAEEPTLLAAAREMAALGDFEGEAALLEAMLGARSSVEVDPEMLTAYAFALAKVGRANEGLQVARTQLNDDAAVGVLALAYVKDDAVASRALARSDNPWAVGVGRLLEELDTADREPLREAVRGRLEGRYREALAAYSQLRRRALSPPAESLVVFEMACLQAALGRPGQALGSFRWVTRNVPGWSSTSTSTGAPSEALGREAARRAGALAERLGLESEAIDFARLYSLSATTPTEEYASRLNQVRLGLKSGSEVHRQEVLVLVSDLLVPAVADGRVGSEEALAATWVLDLYGEHEKANAVLAAVFSNEAEGSRALPGLVSALHWLPAEAVFDVSPAAVPEWLVRRLELASRVLGPGRRRLLDGLLQLATGSPVSTVDVEAVIKGLDTEGERRRARIALDYIVGNRALNDGRMAEATARFGELLELDGQRADAGHLRTLREMATTVPDEVGDWLLALRESRSVVWAEVARMLASVTGLVDLGGTGALAQFADRLPPAPRLEPPDPEHGREVLARFQQTHPEWPLADAVAYYRAGLLRGRAQPRAFRTFLHRYPDSVFWDEAGDAMVQGLENEGAYWLAAQWLEELLEVRPEARVALLRRIARLYRSRLAEPAVAVAWAKRAATEAEGTGAWPGAQQALVVALGEAKLWAEQAEAAATLVSTAPESEWVRSGGALLVRAQALERAGDWQQAGPAYLEFVEKFPDHEELQDGRLLVRVIPHLSLSDLRRLHRGEQEKMRAALPELSRGERERVFRLVPELAQVSGRR